MCSILTTLSHISRPCPSVRLILSLYRVLIVPQDGRWGVLACGYSERAPPRCSHSYSTSNAFQKTSTGLVSLTALEKRAGSHSNVVVTDANPGWVPHRNCPPSFWGRKSSADLHANPMSPLAISLTSRRQCSLSLNLSILCCEVEENTREQRLTFTEGMPRTELYLPHFLPFGRGRGCFSSFTRSYSQRKWSFASGVLP